MLANESFTKDEALVWRSVVDECPVEWKAGHRLHLTAAFVRKLALTRRIGNRGGVIQISDADIDGDLDFESATLVAPIMLKNVELRNVILEQAVAPGIYIKDSRLRGLKATQLKTENFNLNGTTCAAAVTLVDARISGVLSLVGARLGLGDGSPTHPGGTALDAHNIHVEGDLCAKRLEARGQVNVSGGHVRGCMDLSDVAMENEKDWALDARSLKVDNGLNLSGEARGGILLSFAHIKGPLDTRGAQISGSADGRREAVSAALMHVEGDLLCGGRPERLEPLRVSGALCLPGDRIEGHLDLSGVEVVNPGRKALLAEGIEIGDCLMAVGLTVKGNCNLVRAGIGDVFDCSGATFAECLILKHATMGELTAKGLRVDGGCDLASATIKDNVDCSGAEFGTETDVRLATPQQPEVDGSGREALFAEGIKVGVRLDALDLIVKGSCNLANARVGDVFKCSRATFAGSLDLQHATICELVAEDLHVDGAGRMASVKIVDRFNCSGATFAGSLDLQHATIGDVTARGLRVDGVCNLANVTITDSLDCSGAEFGAGMDLRPAASRQPETGCPGRRALIAEGIKVGVRLDALDLIVKGSCNLANARVGDVFNCSGATFAGSLDLQHANIGKLVAMSLRIAAECDFASVKIKDDFDCSGAEFGTKIDLQLAAARQLTDRDTRWPDETPGRTILSDFTYASLHDIHDGKKTVEKRIEWVSNHGRYSPQVYNQLASAYRGAGEEAAALKVLIAKQRAKSKERRNQVWPPFKAPMWVWDRLMDWTMGYGYRPLRILGCLIGLVIIGTAVFEKLADDHKHLEPGAKSTWGDFYPPLYALDLLFPAAGIGDRTEFLTHAEAVWLSGLFTLLGWALGLIVIAGVSGLYKRD